MDLGALCISELVNIINISPLGGIEIVEAYK